MTTTVLNQPLVNTLIHGDCIEGMQQISTANVDFILTDPPYLVNYRDRTGRSLLNDSNDSWLKPAMREAYRVLRQDRLAVMFYGWGAVDKFLAAWREAGFYPVGHIVFRKQYASQTRFVRSHHEQAYVLAKGRPTVPQQPVADVIDMDYSGNKLHPTQKPMSALVPLIRSFTLPGEWILDPFAGSASTCAAAMLTDRKYIGIEMDEQYFRIAQSRLDRIHARIAARRSVTEETPSAG